MQKQPGNDVKSAGYSFKFHLAAISENGGLAGPGNPVQREIVPTIAETKNERQLQIPGPQFEQVPGEERLEEEDK